VCRDDGSSCCEVTTRQFTLFVGGAVVQPYKGKADEEYEPWDWDGTISEVVRNIARAAARVVATYFGRPDLPVDELLDAIFDAAPELFAGTVPPDPFFVLRIGEDEIYRSEHMSNTVEPNWNIDVPWVLDLRANNYLIIEVYDHDFAFHDLIDSISFSVDVLQAYAGRGLLSWGPFDGVYEIWLEVIPQ
jgi:hypothetical protein